MIGTRTCIINLCCSDECEKKENTGNPWLQQHSLTKLNSLIGTKLITGIHPFAAKA